MAARHQRRRSPDGQQSRFRVGKTFGTSTPSAAYCVILFRKVRTEMPSKRAVPVRLPWLLESVSKTRSRSTSLRDVPTSQRARRRRDAVVNGAGSDRCPMTLLRCA